MGLSVAARRLTSSGWAQWRVWVYALWVSGIVVLVQVMFAALLGGLPVCTFPFVLTTWVAISGLHARHPRNKGVPATMPSASVLSHSDAAPAQGSPHASNTDGDDEVMATAMSMPDYFVIDATGALSPVQYDAAQAAAAAQAQASGLSSAEVQLAALAQDVAAGHPIVMLTLTAGTGTGTGVDDQDPQAAQCVAAVDRSSQYVEFHTHVAQSLGRLVTTRSCVQFVAPW